MLWLYVVFAGLCFVASAAHATDHARHHVPGLLFVAIAIALEGVEYAWIAFHWGDLPMIYFKNIITSIRILLVLGFWLGVRYGELSLGEIKRPGHAARLAAEGYAGLFVRILRHPWRMFRSGYQRLRSWHDRSY